MTGLGPVIPAHPRWRVRLTGREQGRESSKQRAGGNTGKRSARASKEKGRGRAAKGRATWAFTAHAGEAVVARVRAKPGERSGAARGCAVERELGAAVRALERQRGERSVTRAWAHCSVGGERQGPKRARVGPASMTDSRPSHTGQILWNCSRCGTVGRPV
jgi:hypothetical protein